jgi:hypothetical protein
MSKTFGDNDSIEMPFGGLLGNSVIVRVLQELVADPTSTYSQSDLSKLTESSMPSVKDAIVRLEGIGLLRKTNKNKKHPSYVVVSRSKSFIALTLLAYAVLDDRQGSSIMEDAMSEYLEDFEERHPKNMLDRNLINYKNSLNNNFLVRLETSTGYIEDSFDEGDPDELLLE